MISTEIIVAAIGLVSVIGSAFVSSHISKITVKIVRVKSTGSITLVLDDLYNELYFRPFNAKDVNRLLEEVCEEHRKSSC